MKRLLTTLLGVLLGFSAMHAADGQTAAVNPFSAYNANYFIFGDWNDQVKFQFSIKYDLFHALVPKLGFYFGYTQTSFWALYSASSPFTVIEFNPDLFWRFESKNNFLGDADLFLLDYFQIGVDHKSDGKEGAESRGIDRAYAQIQLSLGKELNFGVNFRYWLPLDYPKDNPDIQQYVGSFETRIFGRWSDPGAKYYNEEISFTLVTGGGPNTFVMTNGYQMLEIKIRPILFARPYIQLFHGYSESILDYNKTSVGFLQSGIAARVGAIFEIF